jgi:hypothetical protein
MPFESVNRLIPDGAAPLNAGSPARARAMPARPYTVFMLLKANPPWLALSRDERDALYDSALVMIFNRFPSVRLRCFDASAFHGRCSDILVWDTTDMPEYHEAVQALRQHALLDQRHFEIVDVITSIPDGWRDFEWNSGRACA